MQNRLKWLLATIVVLALSLVSLLVLTPRIDGKWHDEYLANLTDMEMLAIQLERDYLRAQTGATLHYDFIEADLQALEKAAALMQAAPGFVSESYSTLSSQAQSSYQEHLGQLRTELDRSKRVIGLLRNSRRAGQILIARAASKDDSAPTLRALHVLSKRLLGSAESQTAVTQALAAIEQSAGPLASQIRLHVDTVTALDPRLTQSSQAIESLLRTASEPVTLRQQYKMEHYQAVSRTQVFLWLTNGIAAMLVVIVAIFALQSRAERNRAREARAALDAQLDATNLAVSNCTHILDKIASGRFDSRVEQSFEGDLEALATAVNRTADRIQATMTELTRVMNEVKDGRFSVQVDERMEGDLRLHVDQAMSSLQVTFSAIERSMAAMSDGIFDQLVNVECKGELARLSDTINATMSTVSSGLSNIEDVVVAQARGDMTQRIEAELPGQLAVLTGAVNQSAERLLSTFLSIRNVAAQVDSAASSVSEDARSVMGSIEDQSNSLGSAANSAGAIVEAIEHNANALERASAIGASAKAKASDGMQIAQQAQAGMDSLISSSREISDIVGIIESIAFQTNLLALNAAVEAARASEHGRGFAVVANEVRQLAQECAAASANIKELIENSLAHVQRSAADVQATGEVLGAVDQAVVEVAQIIEEIALSAQTQKLNTEQVSETVSRVASQSESNFGKAKNNSQMSNLLSEHASQLRAMISIFELNKTESAEPAPNNPPAIEHTRSTRAA